MRYLFLDDIRMPQQVANYIMPVELRPKYNKENWHIVRNYDEFVAWILENGLPDVVSFDHDLAEAHYNPDTSTESFEYLERTGHDCAKWLVDFCTHEHLQLPLYYIHSMNPVGSENIKNCLVNFKATEMDESMFSIHTKPWSKAAFRMIREFSRELRHGNKTKRMIKRLKRV